MTLFQLTSGANDVREKVSQLLDYATQSIDATNLGNKGLYTAANSARNAQMGPVKVDKEYQKNILNA